jgi:hypothetical protein
MSHVRRNWLIGKKNSLFDSLKEHEMYEEMEYSC